jgi:uncharacterized protein YbjT (DUF2867 family)
MSTSKPIFVVGATGRHGGTGGIVARSLLNLGIPVRGLARTLDARADKLRADGAEIVTGDLNDRQTLIGLLDGIETAYFTYPISGGIVNAAANFASAGRAAGLKRVVVMSMAPSHPQSPSHLGRAQWLAEELFEWSGVSCLHLRIAAVFLENIELLHRHEIINDHVMLNSFENIPISWVSGEDVGRLAVAALLHPEKFEQKTAVYPGAPKQYTQSEIAETISGYLGYEVTHRTIPRAEWYDRMVQVAKHDPRVSADMAGHISAVAASLKQPFPPNDMIGEITGRPPLSLIEALTSKRIALN